MSLAVDICQAIDSAVSRYYQDDFAEQAVIYKLHEQDTIKNREQLHKEMWRLAALALYAFAYKTIPERNALQKKSEIGCQGDRRPINTGAAPYF